LTNLKNPTIIHRLRNVAAFDFSLNIITRSDKNKASCFIWTQTTSSRTFNAHVNHAGNSDISHTTLAILGMLTLIKREASCLFIAIAIYKGIH
jgi:hypothetical protein